MTTSTFDALLAELRDVAGRVRAADPRAVVDDPQRCLLVAASVGELTAVCDGARRAARRLRHLRRLSSWCDSSDPASTSQSVRSHAAASTLRVDTAVSNSIRSAPTPPVSKADPDRDSRTRPGVDASEPPPGLADEIVLELDDLIDKRRAGACAPLRAARLLAWLVAHRDVRGAARGRAQGALGPAVMGSESERTDSA